METCAVCGCEDASCNHCSNCGAPMCQSCTDAGEDCPCDENLEVELPDMEFENEGSALRKATPDNPRIFACPTCGEPNRLTGLDVQRHYQCDDCADRAEAGVP